MALRLGGMTAFELRDRMSDEEYYHWAKYYECYHDEAEIRHAELTYWQSASIPRKKGEPPPFKEFLREVKKSPTKKKTSIGDKWMKQLGYK